jgi:hypothetical protein
MMPQPPKQFPHPFTQRESKRRSSILAALTSLGLNLLFCPSSLALDQDSLLLLTDPLDLTLLQPDAVLPEGVVTSATISPTGLTIPSLWWTDDQFGGKLLDTWLAYPGIDGTPPRVDLVVNQQVWSLYNYVERYTFVNHFGSVGQDYGYSTRVFNRQQELLAAYICDFNQLETAPTALAPEAVTEAARQVNCEIFLDSSGQGGLQGVANPLGALQPTGRGTAQP